MIWAQNQQYLTKIQQNLGKGKYKMIATEHQHFFVIEVTLLAPDPFQQKYQKGTGTYSVFLTIKIFKELLTRCHTLFVCKVSFDSDRYIWSFKNPVNLYSKFIMSENCVFPFRAFCLDLSNLQSFAILGLDNILRNRKWQSFEFFMLFCKRK